MSYAVSITQDGTVLNTAGKYLDQDIVVGMSDNIKKSAQTYTPTTVDQTIAAGQYLSGAQTIKGDANLVANNIKQGVSIFGVNGNLTPGITPSGTKNITANGTYDVTQFASAVVNVPPINCKTWIKTITPTTNEVLIVENDPFLLANCNKPVLFASAFMLNPAPVYIGGTVATNTLVAVEAFSIAVGSHGGYAHGYQGEQAKALAAAGYTLIQDSGHGTAFIRLTSDGTKLYFGGNASTYAVGGTYVFTVTWSDQNPA